MNLCAHFAHFIGALAVKLVLGTLLQHKMPPKCDKCEHEHVNFDEEKRQKKRKKKFKGHKTFSHSHSQASEGAHEHQQGACQAYSFSLKLSLASLCIPCTARGFPLLPVTENSQSTRPPPPPIFFSCEKGINSNVMSVIICWRAFILFGGVRT